MWGYYCKNALLYSYNTRREQLTLLPVASQSLQSKLVSTRSSGSMTACRSFCPCFGITGDDDDDLGRSNLDPVLLISGIGGSILHSKKKRRGFQTRVWVRIFLADLEFKKKLWSLYNPKTGFLLSSCISCLVYEKMRKTIREMEFRVLCFYGFILFLVWFGGKGMRWFNLARGSSWALGKFGRGSFSCLWKDEDWKKVVNWLVIIT